MTDVDLPVTSDRQLADGQLGPVAITASSLDTLTRSELDVQIVTAHRYPRSLALFKTNALAMIRLDRETAEECYYVLTRRKADGTMARIEGPSIRLAEIVSTAWGNLRAGARVISESDREVVAQGYAHDLQTNYAVFTEVRRRIVDRQGRRYSDDMVIVTANAACAIARRNATLAVIPRAYVNPLVEAAKKVAAGDLNTLREGRARAITAAAELGITAVQVCARFGRVGVEDLDLADLADLKGALQAIRDGESTVAAEFPPPTTVEAEPVDRRVQLRDKVRQRRGTTSTPASGGAPAAEADATAPPATGAAPEPGSDG